MSITNKNSVSLSSISHINNILKTSISAFNGVMVATGAGITRVSGQNGGAQLPEGAGTSLAYTFPNPLTLNSLVVLGAAFGGAVADTLDAGDLTQTAGTATLGPITQHLVTAPVVDGATSVEHISIWSAIVTGAGTCTLTVGGRPSGRSGIIGADEFAGNWTDARLNSSNSNFSTADGATTANSGAVTSPAAALMFAVGGSYNPNNAVWTDDASFTNVYNNGGPYPQGDGSVNFRIVSTGTTDTSNWTKTGSDSGWAAGIGVFVEGGAAPALGVTDKASGFAASFTTPGVTTTAGSTIVVACAFQAGTFSSVSHSKAGSLVEIQNPGFDNFGTSIGSRLFYLTNNPGGAAHTFTLTMTGGAPGAILIMEILNAAVSSFDLGARQADATSPFDSPAIATTQATEMLAGFFITPTGSAVVPGNSFVEAIGDTAVVPISLAYRLVSSIGSYNSSFTQTGSPTDPQVWIAGFKGI